MGWEKVAASYLGACEALQEWVGLLEALGTWDSIALGSVGCGVLGLATQDPGCNKVTVSSSVFGC